jgi:hypothetical protein
MQKSNSGAILLNDKWKDKQSKKILWETILNIINSDWTDQNWDWIAGSLDSQWLLIIKINGYPKKINKFLRIK